jgi:hypothetical protein
MKSIRVSARIKKDNQLFIDELLYAIKPQKVKIKIIFLGDDDEDDDIDREPSLEEISQMVGEALAEYERGEPRPVSEMWNDIMIETTGEINDKGQLILDRPLKQVNPQFVDVAIFFTRNQELPECIDDEGYQALVKTLSLPY